MKTMVTASPRIFIPGRGEVTAKDLMKNIPEFSSKLSAKLTERNLPVMELEFSDDAIMAVGVGGAVLTRGADPALPFDEDMMPKCAVKIEAHDRQEECQMEVDTVSNVQEASLWYVDKGRAAWGAISMT